MMTGKIIKLKVNWSDTIDQIKQKIQDLEGVPTCQQFLIFADKKLHNYHTHCQITISKRSPRI